MNEDIAFLDWAEKLDSGTNHWLPAYGFQQPSHIQEVLLQERNSENINDDDHGCGSGGGTFLFLETIVEETSDDLRSESDYSVGPVGWPDSDSDAHSVIHVPNHFDSTSVWNGSERDLAVPKKRRRRGVGGGGGVHNTDPGVHDEEDEADDEEQPSRSSSLLQFETLERHCLDYETVFKTSATSEPFLHASSSLNSHFYLDQPKWTFTTFKPPKEPDEDLSSLSSQCSSTSSREISSSENEASLLSRCSKSISSQPDRCTVQRGPSSLRTFRSFDSLVPDRPSVPEKSNDFASLNSLRFSDKSQSLNLNEAFLDSFEDEPASTVIPVSRSFYKTVDCLSSLDSTEAKKRDSLEYKDTDPEKKVEQEAEKIQGAQRSKDDAAKVYLQRSAENLSEDSGFGDGHALKGSVSSLLQLRRTSSSSAVFPIPEDEADFQYSPRPVLPRPPDEGTRPAAAAGAEKLKLAKGGEEIPRGEEGPAAINSSWQSGTAADGDVERAGSVVSCASPVSCAPKPSKVNRSLLSEFSASDKDEAVIRPEPKREPPPLPTAPVPTRPRVVRNDSFKMASRLPVVSTPNLHNLITDEEFAQIQEHKTQLLQEDEYLSRSYSLKKMATNFSESKLNKKNSKSSGSNIQITTSFVNLSSTANGSNKGVHFCPIVSKVSWQETYSSDEESSGGEYESEDNEYSELNGSGSSGSSPEKDSSSSPDLDALVEKLLSSGNAGEPRREILERRNSERAKMMQEYIKQNIIGGNLHMHDGGSPLPSAPAAAATAAVGAHAGSHVAGPVRAHSAPASAAPVSARTMDEPVSKRMSNKLGGFFQRFSFRRRKPRKEEHPKVRAEDNHHNLNLNNNNNSDSAVKSAEVLVIPLHDAGTGAPESEAVVSSKPPLPKLPPRTVGVGSSQAVQGVKRSPPRRRPECGDVGLSGAGSGAAVSTMSNVGSIDPTSRVGLLETDLDSNVTSSKHGAPSKKARSLLNLEGPHDMTTLRPVCNINPDANYLANNVDSRAKSMEFLLDKENHAAIQPPENQLQKVGGDRILSEHELRVQKSLQKLNVPDWYKNSNVPSSGFILKRHSDAGHGHGHHSHLTLQPWQGLSSKTTSLSSLGSSYSNSAGHGPPPRSPTGSHRGGMMSPSPTPTHVFSRWSTTRLNSGCTSSNTSPCSSARSSFNYRQPYLGWRSQERLNKPRTPAERLAAGLLPQQKQQVQNVPSLTDVQTSIKEVTAAIVHYVSNRSEACNPSPKWNNELSTSPSRSASPRGSTGRLCWLESSFVGSRPTEIPATPNVTDLKSSEINNKDLFLDLNNHRVHSPITNRCSQNGSEEEATSPYCKRTPEIIKTVILNKPSPNSTTMEDVLDSLLGLPPASRSPSPGLGGNSVHHSCGDLRSPIAGSASKTGNNEKPANSVTEAAPAMNLRRVSFDAAVSNSQNSSIPDTLVRCRYNKCNKVADVSEARRTFKTCHNCAHVYCSRECRRAHWEKHRKTCLHSRVGSLCRQVLNASKEDPDSLNHLSLIARRGYLSQGRGAVKSFFSSPEMAEKFVKNGFSFLGEPTFIAWSDILPSEMNSDLYTELIRLCKNYNPDTRFVLYVAVCVVSEVPTRGAVKWERQVVSRCAKIRLCQSLMSRHPIDGSKTDTNSTLILTSLPGNDGSQRARQISFTNIQRHLRHRGVSLQKHFPDVYKNLCTYVEGTSVRFTPVTIYPKDSHSGKTFMCVIMLDSEPEQVNMVPRGNTPSQTIDVSVEQ